LASRRANTDGCGARRRRFQGCKIEKRQNKTAPCAPALFIGPSAQLGIFAMPARLPASSTYSKQRLDG
jgi:hypothetical protein